MSACSLLALRSLAYSSVKQRHDDRNLGNSVPIVLDKGIHFGEKEKEKCSFGLLAVVSTGVPRVFPPVPGSGKLLPPRSWACLTTRLEVIPEAEAWSPIWDPVGP